MGKLDKGVKRFAKKVGKKAVNRAKTIAKSEAKAIKKTAKAIVGQVEPELDLLPDVLDVPGAVLTGNFKKAGKTAAKIGKSVVKNQSQQGKNWVDAIGANVDTAKALIGMNPNKEPGIPGYIQAVHTYGDQIKKGAQIVTPKIVNKVGSKNIVKKGYDKVKKLLNHPEWYGKYPEYITTNLTWGSRKEARIGKQNIAVGVRVSIAQTIPMKRGSTSQAFKDAMNAIFIKVRGANSGAFNYNANDVATYIECVRGILMLSWKLRRDLKLLNEVQIYQSQTPDMLLKIAGYTQAQIDDMKANQALYISRLNQQANRINNTFPLPPEMTVFERAKYISETIIKDSDAFKASYYIYSPSVILASVGQNQDVEFVQADTGTFNDRLDQIDLLITNLLAYESTYGPDTATKIAGDLLKAYGSNALKAPLEYIDAQQHPVFLYDEYALEQIQNGTPICRNFQPSGVSSSVVSGVFSFVPGDLEFNAAVDGSPSNTYTPNLIPGVAYNENTEAAPILITTHKNDVTGLMAISLTRLMPTLSAKAATSVAYDTATAFAVKDCGTEMPLDYRVYYYAKANNTISDNGFRISQVNQPNNTLRVGLWSQMDYAPTLMFFEANNNTNYTEVIDLDNYTEVTNAQLHQMHDAAVFSEYKTVDIQEQVNFKAVKR